MYRYQKKDLTENSCKYKIYKEDNQLSYYAFLDLLQQEIQFRTFFIELLSDIPFRAYQWEMPPVTARSADQPFEFVVTKNVHIDLPPDPGPFSQYFKEPNDNAIAVFDNLGGDAKLIAPAPAAEDLNYSHIGVFTGEAPAELQHQFWQATGRITEEHLSDQPLWLNTAGGGVAWLHVRLDTRSKYYRHRPYKR